MTDIDRVCTPQEFMAATVMERRKLVLAQIDLTPELWEQEYWTNPRNTCGTSYCAAGWTATLAGADVRASGWLGENSPFGQHVEKAAADLLGFSYSEAKKVWDGDNTRERLEELMIGEDAL